LVAGSSPAGPIISSLLPFFLSSAIHARTDAWSKNFSFFLFVSSAPRGSLIPGAKEDYDQQAFASGAPGFFDSRSGSSGLGAAGLPDGGAWLENGRCSAADRRAGRVGA
jgi:hypothetical protein